jgi:hypothetical protein
VYDHRRDQEQANRDSKARAEIAAHQGQHQIRTVFFSWQNSIYFYVVKQQSNKTNK